ncbi:hypothetical protein HanRHA438_Chr04g0175591 [Helianthus annuus]|uniref:Uncharacterized protein n=1 Tax=Helianthus annuus TaxID=4232 RepID=A0A9K3NRR9_HELAN|nr:hypothetical protein HanXRQr2_Chr04g0165961 [Helianthus annuus]KAJ0581025.1 hypothetical protein HanHA300_Chr04g0136241 [Helianthus annuus]KAJ0588805.1 hypothetical protein HanIR_Chr04g0178981 [Helianthus annuus]KAJ0596968.1 hypothetical protein HanHA89_Chr04g0149161 [Helianthus annuus]KAJ0757650.1 hypothetical protein HanLR1_Chr04g0141271 [Helianthus annuus]
MAVEFTQCLEVINSTTFMTEKDKWCWSRDASGTFSTLGLGREMARSSGTQEEYKHVWLNWASIKINFFV